MQSINIAESIAVSMKANENSSFISRQADASLLEIDQDLSTWIFLFAYYRILV